ncbi:MAG: hypothetical protein IJF11_03835 [Clostridia bacterium]|nr:hypothetical protein [Clostridia bacterium]
MEISEFNEIINPQSDCTNENDEQIDFEEMNVGEAEYSKRDKLYTVLLKKFFENYGKKSSHNKCYKFFFFITIMLTFVAIVGFSVYFMAMVALKETSTYSDIPTIIGAVSGIISAIIVLPKIIAEYLFPVNEDENMLQLVKNMQINDSDIRKVVSNLNKSFVGSIHYQNALESKKVVNDIEIDGNPVPPQ